MTEFNLSRRHLIGGSVAGLAAGIIPIHAAHAEEEAEEPIRPLTGKMTYEQVRDRAREMMQPRCWVCPECNGRGPCVGQVPGFGGMGASRGF